MKHLTVQQGSPEWLSLRGRSYRGSSEAPVIAGVGRISRTELLRMKSTGDAREFSRWVMENLIEPGHETEAQARVHLEEDLGEDLFPVVAASDDDYLVASFDGMTMDDETAFEHKLWNAELAAAMRDGRLTPLVEWQVVHQFAVGDRLKRIIVICSDGTRENRERLDVLRDPAKIELLRRNWRQFDEDLAGYQHVEVAPKPAPSVIQDLPALAVRVEGALTVQSNLDLFGERLHAFLEQIPRSPATDQDFADCEEGCKTLKRAEDALEAAEANALAQTTSVEEMRSLVASLKKVARDNRLYFEKLVVSRKDAVRAEIRTAGASAIAAHLQKLDERLGARLMPTMGGHLAEVMKGKKTIKGLRDAVDQEVARVKIEASAIADRIQANLKALDAEGADHRFLFADLAQIVQKAEDDFARLVRSRVTDHKAAEEKRLEAEREKIRAEEAAKLAASQQAPLIAPIGAAAPAPRLAVVPAAAPLATGTGPRRPTDEEITTVVAQHFGVSIATATEWLIGWERFDSTAVVSP